VRVIDSQLAWDLADQLGRHLSDIERMDVFVDLGGGAHVAAIHRLIIIAAERRHPLPSMIFKQLRAWVFAYDAHERYAPALAQIESACKPVVAKHLHRGGSIVRAKLPQAAFGSTTRVRSAPDFIAHDDSAVPRRSVDRWD
jgi:hypothetical protein